MSYCEDFPCCGHTPGDPCPGQAVIDEPWYCDDCGGMHHGMSCPYDEYDPLEDDCCSLGDYDHSTARDRWECTYCGEPVDYDPPDPFEVDDPRDL